MAELVPFAVPTDSDKTLLEWELSSGPTADELHNSLFTEFSHFGLLYSVRVFPNAAVARPGFCAIIKFYSARDARRAQKACDRKQLFQKSPVKIYFRRSSQGSSRRRAFSADGGHFGLGICTDLSMPHARKTWQRSCTTRTLLMRRRFSTRMQGRSAKLWWPHWWSRLPRVRKVRPRPCTRYLSDGPHSTMAGILQSA
ncbi:uncharacterized protein [Eulemur rufifrons]|uniref:uncharacterized protein n=1 Tax=Eulemur rufifrons TaxID=859984 RepID=UPI003742E6A9